MYTFVTFKKLPWPIVEIVENMQNWRNKALLEVWQTHAILKTLPPYRKSGVHCQQLLKWTPNQSTWIWLNDNTCICLYEKTSAWYMYYQNVENFRKTHLAILHWMPSSIIIISSIPDPRNLPLSSMATWWPVTPSPLSSRTDLTTVVVENSKSVLTEEWFLRCTLGNDNKTLTPLNMEKNIHNFLKS